MTKRIAQLLFMAVLCVPLFASSATVDDLKNSIASKQAEIDALVKEIAAYQKTLDATENKSKTLTNEIAKLNARVKQLNNDIALTRAKIQRTELDIERLGKEIGTTEANISNKQSTVAAIIREVQDAEGESTLEILLANTRVSDFFARLDTLQTLNKSLGLALEDLRQQKEVLTGNKTQKETQHAQLASLQNAFVAQVSAQQQQKQEKATILAQTKAKESEYQKIIAEREKVQQSIRAEIAKYEEELIKLIDPSKLPSKGKGVLGYPVANPFMTQGFGYTSFSTSRKDIYKTGFHNGIDFRAALGTPVLAASGGEIVDTGNTDLTCPGSSWGKWVVVKHTNNLTTVYGHLSGFAVTRGDTVTRGQTIAYSGKTGYSTGPHLHFTVYDSSTVKFGSSPSGRCKNQPFGGYLNPLDYL